MFTETPPMRHFDSRRSNRSGRFFYFREQIQTVIMLCFYPQLCQFLMKIIPVINWRRACIKMSAEDDNFLREGWRCVNLMIFIWELLCFGLTEKALFQVILGLLLEYADWEKGGVCLKVCMWVSWLRIIEICSSLCDQTTAFISRWDE